jgi:hypothetical protein
MMLFQCSWTTVTLISACKELMLDVFSSIGEDVMVGVGCTARRDARNSDLLKIDEIDPTYAWTLPFLQYAFCTPDWFAVDMIVHIAGLRHRTECECQCTPER